jgi:hypothetical protein
MSAKFLFRLATGFHFDRRGIGFLDGEDNELDAAEVFDSLPEKTLRTVRSRMDYWLQGGVHDKWFHGWPNVAEYKNCFVFKWDEKKQSHRLYGFLCHPKPESAPGFRLCVLITHALKDDFDTDLSILDRVNQYGQDQRTIMAIRTTYLEYRGGRTWRN